jgi:hypothetical protein
LWLIDIYLFDRCDSTCPMLSSRSRRRYFATFFDRSYPNTSSTLGHPATPSKDRQIPQPTKLIVRVTILETAPIENDGCLLFEVPSTF